MLPEFKMWKLEYLRKVYPLITNPTEDNFDQLECYFTSLLPDDVQMQMSNNVYRARLPGPSCGELPCDCSTGVPDVGFAPNPMLKDGWPFCNLPGPEGEACCKDVESYKKCYQEGKVSWAANDTWTGNEKNVDQGPPKLGQLWKPSLWPKYTLAVNKYDPIYWNNFYNAGGDPDWSWIEGLHSSFSIVNTTFGVWFYKAKGSGIFVNLGKTFAALNKLDAIIKLLGLDDFADYIMRPYDGSKNILDPSIAISETGLGGVGGIDYWLNGGFHVHLDATIAKLYGHGPVTKDHIKQILGTAAYGLDYNLNRICNTGILDHLIIRLARDRGYHSVQFTVQPNVYTGWTTEVMILGNSPKIYTAIEDIPYDNLRVLDPNNLPHGRPGCDSK